MRLLTIYSLFFVFTVNLVAGISCEDHKHSISSYDTDYLRVEKYGQIQMLKECVDERGHKTKKPNGKYLCINENRYLIQCQQGNLKPMNFFHLYDSISPLDMVLKKPSGNSFVGYKVGKYDDIKHIAEIVKKKKGTYRKLPITRVKIPVKEVLGYAYSHRANKSSSEKVQKTKKPKNQKPKSIKPQNRLLVYVNIRQPDKRLFDDSKRDEIMSRLSKLSRSTQYRKIDVRFSNRYKFDYNPNDRAKLDTIKASLYYSQNMISRDKGYYFDIPLMLEKEYQSYKKVIVFDRVSGCISPYGDMENVELIRLNNMDSCDKIEYILSKENKDG